MSHYATLSTPIGELLLRAEGERLSGVFHLEVAQPAKAVSQWRYDPDPELSPPAVLKEAQAQLDAYFRHRLERFDLPLAPHGSAFQQQVWEALAEVPFGDTASYGELASRLGFGARPARAIGAAVGRNPLCLVVPCHRVLGRGGELRGYAGGIGRKRWLLEHEGVLSAPLWASID